MRALILTLWTLWLIGCGSLSEEARATLDRRCPGQTSADKSAVYNLALCTASIRIQSDPMVQVIGLTGQISAVRSLLNKTGTCAGGTCGDKAGIGTAQEGPYLSVRGVCPGCGSRAGSDTGPGMVNIWERISASPKRQPPGIPYTSPISAGGERLPKTNLEFGKPADPIRAGTAQGMATTEATIRAFLGGGK